MFKKEKKFEAWMTENFSIDPDGVVVIRAYVDALKDRDIVRCTHIGSLNSVIVQQEKELRALRFRMENAQKVFVKCGRFSGLEIVPDANDWSQFNEPKQVFLIPVSEVPDEEGER